MVVKPHVSDGSARILLVYAGIIHYRVDIGVYSFQDDEKYAVKNDIEKKLL